MPIISKETWDKLTQEEKETIRQVYDGLEPMTDRAIECVMNSLFGKENLQPQPLTYDDIERALADDDFF